MTILENPLIQFLTGGIILSGGAYLANFAHPFLASLLIAFPLELLMLFLIKNKKRRQAYTKSLILVSLSLLCGIIFIYLIEPTKMFSANIAILLSFLIWIIFSITSYFIIN